MAGIMAIFEKGNYLLISRLKVRFLHGPPRKHKGNQLIRLVFLFLWAAAYLAIYPYKPLKTYKSV